MSDDFDMGDYDVDVDVDCDSDYDVDSDVSGDYEGDITDGIDGDASGLDDVGDFSYEATSLDEIEVILDGEISSIAEIQESLEAEEVFEESQNQFFTVDFNEEYESDIEENDEPAEFDVEFIENEENIDAFMDANNEGVDELLDNMSKDELEQLSEQLKDEEFAEAYKELYCLDEDDVEDGTWQKVKKL